MVSDAVQPCTVLEGPHLPFLPFHKQGLEALLIELLLLTVRFIFRLLLLQRAANTVCLHTRQGKKSHRCRPCRQNTASGLKVLTIASRAAFCCHLFFFIFLESLLFQNLLFLLNTLLEPAPGPNPVNSWATEWLSPHHSQVLACQRLQERPEPGTAEISPPLGSIC